MRKIGSTVGRLVRDDEGATLLEYGMLLLLITVLSIVAITSIGGKVSKGFSSADSQLP